MSMATDTTCKVFRLLTPCAKVTPRQGISPTGDFVGVCWVLSVVSHRPGQPPPRFLHYSRGPRWLAPRLPTPVGLVAFPLPGTRWACCQVGSSTQQKISTDGGLHCTRGVHSTECRVGTAITDFSILVLPPPQETSWWWRPEVKLHPPPSLAISRTHHSYVSW